MSQPAVDPTVRRQPRGIGGLLGAMVVVVALVVGIWSVGKFLHAGSSHPVPTVNYAPTLAIARHQAPFHVLAPQPPPAGLRATSVSWDGVGASKVWQVGFLTDQQQFIGLYEGNGASAAFIQAETPATQPGAPVRINGTQWLTLTNSDRGETALVHTVRGVTVVVTGTASRTELVSFVRSLR